MKLFNYFSTQDSLHDSTIITRPDLNLSQWLPVSYRAREELWIPEISVINVLDIKRIGLLEETGSIRVRGDKELFRYQISNISVEISLINLYFTTT